MRKCFPIIEYLPFVLSLCLVREVTGAEIPKNAHTNKFDTGILGEGGPYLNWASIMGFRNR